MSLNGEYKTGQRSGIAFRVAGPALALFVLALFLRFATIWITGAETVEFGDAEDYILHATGLCVDGVYPERGNNRFFRPPGFPVFIAAVTACHPGSVVVIKTGLAVLDASTTILIALLAGFLWRDRRAALAAGAWAAVHPVFLLQVADVRSEGLFMFLLTLALVLFAYGSRDGREWLSLLAGLASGLAALTRPEALLVIVFLAAAKLTRGSPACGRRWRAAVLLLLGATIPLAPWTARNMLRYGEVLIVNDAFGINFWRGASPEMREVTRAASRVDVAQALDRFSSRVTATAAAVEAVADTPAARSRAWFARGIDNIREDPLGYLSFMGLEGLGYWRPWLNPRFHGPAKVVLSALAVVPVLALGLLGLFELRLWNSWAFRVALAFLLLAWLSHLPFQTVMRFRIPFTDPILLALASGLLVRTVPKLIGWPPIVERRSRP